MVAQHSEQNRKKRVGQAYVRSFHDEVTAVCAKEVCLDVPPLTISSATPSSMTVFGEFTVEH